jgi:hypothetical protein
MQIVVHKLPSKVNRRCFIWGIEMADYYRDNPSSASRAVSSHNMHDNPEGLADGKRGECIAALHFDLDPLIALSWRVAIPDKCDLIVGGFRVDVKRTGYNGSRLIWPINKWRYYDNYQFDLLVLTKTRTMAVEESEGYVAGWCEKTRFKRNCRIADGQEPISPGTPYISEWRLDSMGIFPAQRPSHEQAIAEAKRAIAAGQQFEFISGRWP